ncbi:MAG: hypothetical protein ACKO6K_07885, partial [Chitinophagaceae bacterium]
HQAQVPLVMVGLDFAQKRVIFSEPFSTTGDQERDFKKILDFFSSCTGAVPEQDLRHLKENVH